MSVPEIEETIRGLKYKTPFRPFVIELTDSRSILVDNPDAIGFSDGTVGYIHPNGEILMIPYANVFALRDATDVIRSNERP
ncbi:MAG: hypothetical protein L0215_19945 [Gemmataceae bacterium]|nr:hypothetical protein [Gemmataceae bacterium]